MAWDSLFSQSVFICYRSFYNSLIKVILDAVLQTLNIKQLSHPTKVSEYDQEIPQSQTADKPVAKAAVNPCYKLYITTKHKLSSMKYHYALFGLFQANHNR